MDERKKEVMEMLEEMSKEEIADMIIFYTDGMRRANGAILKMQEKVDAGERDGDKLAMEIFKAWYLVTYKEEYKG